MLKSKEILYFCEIYVLCARIFSDIFQKFTEYVSNKNKRVTQFLSEIGKTLKNFYL
jgi:hypothetical protein